MFSITSNCRREPASTWAPRSRPRGFEFLYSALSLYLMMLSELDAATHRPQDFLDSIHNAPNAGSLIVEHYCVNCHAAKPLIDVAAPRMHVSKDWQSRLKQGFDGLFHHTETGIGAMPPRGGCFECTDVQLRQAIQALLPP